MVLGELAGLLEVAANPDLLGIRALGVIFGKKLVKPPGAAERAIYCEDAAAAIACPLHTWLGVIRLFISFPAWPDDPGVCQSHVDQGSKEYKCQNASDDRYGVLNRPSQMNCPQLAWNKSTRERDPQEACYVPGAKDR